MNVFDDIDGPTGPIDTDTAVALVEARLGRPPQDPLEAAVVLEAWGGVTPDHSHALASAVIDQPPTRIGRPETVEAVPAPAPASIWQPAIGDLGFVVGVLMTGLWVAELAAMLGDRTVDIAWRVALPISLGAQWFLRRRYLGGPDGTGRLRRELGRCGIALLTVATVMIAVPDWGPLAAGLTLLWIGGFLVARHGWGLPFGAALILMTIGLTAGVDPRVLLWTSAVAAVAIGGIALARTPVSIRLPGPIGRAVPAALIGAALGVLLVLEPRFPWSARGVLPTLTVIPALIGSLWGGVHMSRLWDVLPPSLARASLGGSDAEPGRLLRSLWRGALLRLVLGAGIGSASVMAVALIGSEWVFAGATSSGTASTASTVGDGQRIVAALLGAHAVLAVAGLVIALLEAFGRWGWGLAAAASGCTVALAIDLADGHPFPGVRILLAAAVALAVGTPVLVALLREPARTLAVGM
jgi:hypothetical protein